MYHLPIEEVVKQTDANIKNGLTTEKAIERAKRDGKNMLQESKRKPAILRFAKELIHVMNIVLFVAFFLTVFIAVTEKSTTDYISSALILTIILVNAGIGFIQENKAEKAVDALKNQTKPYAKVLRDGKVTAIKNEDIAIGDIVLIEAGDIVPADLRLFETTSLQIEQAALTGESVPSEKFTHLIDVPNIALGDRNNLAYSGSVVTYGHGKGIVTAVGMQTEIGRIAVHLQQQTTPQTPLAKRLNKTNTMIAYIMAVISVVIFAVRLITGDKIVDSIMITIAIAVCAIPEALPTCTSITMALATQRMSKRKAIVRNLLAVETLGSTEIICSDKTGTITLNKMTVQNLFTFSGVQTFEIENHHDELADGFKNNKNLKHLCDCMLLCNNTQVKYDSGILSTIGDPTESALIHCIDNFGPLKEETDRNNPRIDELPFDSERKMMSTINKTTDQTWVMYTKGAPASIIANCTRILDNGKIRAITQEDIQMINGAASNFAKSALRVLGYAFKPIDEEARIKLEDGNEETRMNVNDEKELVFIGLTGMIDPPREEVMKSVKTCKRAGIKVVMITGDHPDTAYAIAQKIGIVDSEEQVITGVQLNEISDQILIANINKYSVYARVNPEHKVRIVNAFKAVDKIVAMTGDGVNDAPSIKSADIGIGMGITGTDVTKKVADVILTDDNFATIVDAVEEGRRTHQNIKKTIIYLLGLSLAELVLLTVITLFRMPFYNAILILWLNVVTDTLPAIVMGTLPAEKNVMDKKPNTTRGSLFKGQTGRELILFCIYQVLLVGSVYFLAMYVWNFGAATAITMSYLVFVTIEALQAYNLCSISGTVFSRFTFKSKWMNWAVLTSIVIGIAPVLVPGMFQDTLGLCMLTGNQWFISIAFGVSIIFLVEIYKIFLRRSLKAKSQ